MFTRKNSSRKLLVVALTIVASFIAAPFSTTGVSAETAPAFTLSTNIGTVAQCATLTSYTIASTGGAVSSYTISPAAPKGLVFSSTTGLLSGKPEVVAAATIYTITGTNSAGSASKTYTLTVSAVTDTGIYPTCQKVSGTVGVALTPTARYTDIGIANELNFSISPALVAGLTLNTSTGVITGTPTAVTPATDWVYTVRMDEEDTDLTFFATITMTIAAAPPATTTTTTTTTTIAPAKIITITCTKGTLVKKVKGIAPKCPVGYKRKTK
jgi:hypothetical protein